MEEILIRIALNGGPSAVVLVVGWVWFGDKLRGIQGDLREIKTGKPWNTECTLRHHEIDGRVDRIEKTLNGNLRTPG